jgi:hypothetical protein
MNTKKVGQAIAAIVTSVPWKSKKVDVSLSSVGLTLSIKTESVSAFGGVTSGSATLSLDVIGASVVVGREVYGRPYAYWGLPAIERLKNALLTNVVK